jgi:RNA-directed DNA polymerase
LEDKIVQRALVGVLNAIYECDFLSFSYGFRPGRSPHHALDALATAIKRRKVNWVLDADIRGYFSSLDHSWLERFLEHRIADKRVLRLIQKWLRAGVVEDGKWSETVEGTPQGASVSTLLANVYLRYVFDLWVHQWRSRHARGEVVVVRYADDFVVGFQHLKTLETQGLVRRWREDTNRRVQRTALTPAGEELFERLREVAVRHDERLRSLLTDEEAALLAELLDKLQQAERFTKPTRRRPIGGA